MNTSLFSDGHDPRQQIEAKLAAARHQADMLRAVFDAADERSWAAAESCACAAVDQTLQALTATLHTFNMMLPEPLPLARVSRRHLRDRFHAVFTDSDVLRLIEDEARPGDGWLWWLERKAAGAPFAPLIDHPYAGSDAVIWRDPVDHRAGLEPEPPYAYVRDSLDRMRDLTQRLLAASTRDVERYDQAARTHAFALI